MSPKKGIDAPSIAQNSEDTSKKHKELSGQIRVVNTSKKFWKDEIEHNKKI